MIAYNKNALFNLALIRKAKRWQAKNLLSGEQMHTIADKYKPNLYMPAPFVKIGLFIFTLFIVSAACGFFLLITSDFIGSSGSLYMTFNCLVFAAACIVVLEQIIKTKKTYHSGMDNALLYAGLSFTLGAFAALLNLVNVKYNFELLYVMLALPVTGAAVLRYNDGITALLLGALSYALLFLLLVKLGDISKMLMPFAFMLLSVTIYVTMTRYSKKENFVYWQSSITIIKCLSLLVFYLACNYFIIRECSVHFFNLALAEGTDIPFAFLFYLLTALVPLLYVYYGLKNKDKNLLHIGLLVMASAVLTFKYYFSLGHPEITLTIAGIVMITIAYLAIKYLKSPKHGISFEEDTDEHNPFRANAEALVIAQTFTQHQASQAPDTTEFGGGKFGGGGAGSEF